MFKTILTATGRALEAAANAAGVPIEFAELAVGDGNGNPVVVDESWTFLARERYRAALNVLVQNPNNPAQFIAELIIPATVGGFVLREAGLYTVDGDLFAVANLPETYKPESSEGAFSDTVVRMVFEVTNASAVTIILDPNIAIATRAWVTNAITFGALVPGGLTNQVLAKASNADGDVEWRDPLAAVEVIVESREETQTAAAAQTQFNLAILTSQGTAVYKNGTRLREDQFTITGPTQITLAVGAAAGDKITIVQNEEVGGLTDILLKSQNLADVPDKAAARVNLGLPAWLAAQSVAWSQLSGIPAFASRWPTYAEVTDKPATFTPSAHGHAWGDLSGVPAFASRWPTYAEVTGKPATFTPSLHRHGWADLDGIPATFAPSAHGHAWGDLSGVPAFASRWPTYAEVTGKPATYPPDGHTHTTAQVTGLDGALAAKAPLVNPVFTGTVTAGAFAQSSSLRYKNTVEAMNGATALALLNSVEFKTYFMNEDQSFAAGVIAESLADTALDFVVQRDDEGRPDAVNYQPLFVMACAALQSLAERVAALESR